MSVAHPIDLGSCPITGMTIYSPQEWFFCNSEYENRLGLMDEHIIMVRSQGYCRFTNTQWYLSKIDEIIGRFPDPEHKFVLFEDFTEFSKVDPKARHTYIEVLRKNSRLAGVVYCSPKKSFRLNIVLARALYRIPIPVLIGEIYEEALKLTYQILAKPIPQFYPPNTIPAYQNLINESHGIVFEEVAPRVILITPLPGFSIESLEQAFESFLRILDDMKRHYGSGEHYRIFNLNSVKTLSMHHFWRGLNFFEKLEQDYQCKGSYLYGLHFAAKFLIMVRRKRNYPLVACQNTEDALKRIRTNTEVKKEIVGNPHVLDVLDAIGHINWDDAHSDYQIPDDVDEDFKPLHEALGAIKNDVNQLLFDRKQREEQLETEKRQSVFLSAQNERALRESESLRKKAETAVEIKQRFLANMSHEIRTPMNGIIGMADFLLDSELNTDQKEHLNILKSSAENLLHILNEILHLSKLESGQIELENLEFNFIDLVTEVSEIHAVGMARQKGICVVKEIDESFVPWRKGDANRIRQILHNLMSNAIKFTDQGSVTLRVNGDHFQNQDWVYVEVVDQGIGIPVHRQADIFEPFVQADTSTTRKYGGTGLGLAICRQLAVRMGGYLDVQSEPGQGSTFTLQVALPQLAKAPQIVTEKKTITRFQDFKMKSLILLVEDNLINQKVAAKMLDRLGLEFDLAENGLEAIEAWKQKRHSIILMDCQMPELNGFEATQMIRELQGTDHPFILAMTANAMEGDREKCIRAGMDDYLSKPIKMDLLTEKLQNCGVF